MWRSGQRATNQADERAAGERMGAEAMNFSAVPKWACHFLLAAKAGASETIEVLVEAAAFEAAAAESLCPFAASQTQDAGGCGAILSGVVSDRKSQH